MNPRPLRSYPPDATITAPSSVGPNLTGYTARVSEQIPEAGSTFEWTIDNGLITSEKNRPQITFTAPAHGEVVLSCTVTNTFGFQDPKSIHIPVRNGLFLNIVGLPSSASPDVVLEYPGGKSEAIKGNIVISDPIPGTYKVQAKSVVHDGITHHPWQLEQTFEVEAGVSKEIKVLYPALCFPALIPDVNKSGNTVPMEFVLIPQPENGFTMGSNDAASDGPNSGPTYTVNFAHAFYLARTECTQAQWKAVVGKIDAENDQNPSHFKGDKLPVDNVSWEMVRNRGNGFLDKLNAALADHQFSLPTEAQWEYAYRAGCTTSGFFFGNASELGGYAWFGDNSGGTTHPVATTKPNTWGLYDMAGNVWEFVEDDWHASYEDPITKTKAPENGSAWIDAPRSGDRVFRGGSFVDRENIWFRLAFRSFAKSFLSAPKDVPSCYGFRLASNVPQVVDGGLIRSSNKTSDITYAGTYEVDPNKTYRLSVDAVAAPDVTSKSFMYIGVHEFDKDGNGFDTRNFLYVKDTHSRLARPLKPGNEYVYLDNVNNWKTSDTTIYERKFIFWDWKAKDGTPYPPFTYSRHLSEDDLWDDGAIDAKECKIKLKTAWKGSEVPANTELSQSTSGGSYRYCTAQGKATEPTWTHYTGTVGGIDTSGYYFPTKFCAATRSVKIQFITNHGSINDPSDNEIVWFKNLKFEEVKQP